MAGAVQRRKSEYRLAMWQAWHTGAIYRAKKLPRLDRMLRRLDREKRKKLSDEKIWKGFRMHNAALGGKDNRAKKDG